MKYPRLSRFTAHVSRCFLVCAVAATLLIAPASAQVVEIPDPNLRQAVRDILTLPDEIPITQQEMLRLTTLKAEQSEITNLTGLEYATNVTRLFLGGNQISDLTPLSGLSQLQHLSLWANRISSVLDLSPLANLTEFRVLDITDSQISDITPLANLTQLEWLSLAGTISIEDISPLSNLIQLKFLRLAGNRIVDISPLANLTQLEELSLNDNRIVDISPLSNLTALEKLSIESNQIVDVSPLASLTQLTDLTIANNAITDFRPLFALNLQSVDVDIHKLQELASGEVEIPDPNLERAIREALGLPSEIPLTQLVMSQLTELKTRENQITDLTGLEHATNLKQLALSANEIRDITPLAGLLNLESLILNDNPISDLSPLANLTQLEHLNLAGVHIKDLTPLSNLTQLTDLNLIRCQIRDITPLSNLTQLTWLNISGNRIVDVNPLANLTALEKLWLDNNNWIVDISPLANLTALKELHIERNNIIDFSSLQGLSLTYLTYDEVCELPGPPIQDRTENRSLPSIAQGWGDEIINLPALSHEDRISYHDLYWHGTPFELHFQSTPQGYQFTGDLERAIAEREQLLAQNPNMLFLVEVRQRDAHIHSQYPEDWPYWLRDKDGNLVKDWYEVPGVVKDLYLTDFRRPGLQDIIVQQAIAVAKCGLYDGIFFDWWLENGGSLTNYHTGGDPISYSTPEEEQQARLTILQRIRANVPDDFLILCNSNRRKLPLSAPYINGNFMETFRDSDSGYTNSRLTEIEGNLIWLEENLREPQINVVRGEGIPTEPPGSPNNRRLMRFFTTMSLTLSDGYALYTLGIRDLHQTHIWYPFWDADLGQPIGPTAQPYQNVPSLYIREFTNGWAVYNRSGKAQTITLPGSATPVSDRGSTAASTTHLLPDLDGEIYLKTKSLADVNRDGKVNILDLVQIANEFGKSTPDPNGDGVVNILDLVFVAQQFSQ